VTVSEWVALRELFEHDAVAPSALADRLGMTRGAISKLADRLAAKGLATRAPAVRDDDHRYQALALTHAGRALVPELAGLADENDAEFFGHLERGERETIRRAMQEIARRLGLRSVPLT